MRNQVYVMGRFDLAPDEAFVVDLNDGGAEYFTVPLSNIWGTTLDIVDRTGSLNKAQSVRQRGRQLHLRDRADRPRRGQLDRLRRAARGHPDPAHGRVRRGGSPRRSRRSRAGGQAGPARRRGAAPAAGEPAGHGPPNSPTGEPRICGAYRKGRSSDGALVDHRMLHRLRPRNRARGTGGGPQRGGDRAAGRLGARLRRRVRRSGAGRCARRDGRRSDRGGGVGGRCGVRRHRRPGEQRRSRLPVRRRGGRGRRGAKAVRGQLLRCGEHDQGGAAGDACPRRPGTSSTCRR